MALPIKGFSAAACGELHRSEASRIRARKAIVLYSASDGAATPATPEQPSAYSFAAIHDVMHPVRGIDGDHVRGPLEAVIGPATPLKMPQLKMIVKELFAASEPRVQLLPERLLALQRDMICWWSPAQHKPLFMENKTEFAKECSGKMALHPPLLWIGRPGSISVWALPKSERPAVETELLQAPYHNVYGSGSMCSGTASVPQEAEPQRLEGFEAAFFGSAFTHTNMGRAELTTHPAGYEGLWRELIRTHHRVFPYYFLVPARAQRQEEAVTVGQVISGAAGELDHG